MFHTFTDPTYSIGLIVAAVALVLSVAIGIAWGFVTEDSRKGVLMWGLCTVSVLGFFAVAAWPPLPGQYNQYRPFTGVVSQVGSRFIASDTKGGGTTQKFAVQFADGQTLGCLDTRCSVLKPGQRVTLLCERVFQFAAPSEGWDCNWGALDSAK